MLKIVCQPIYFTVIEKVLKYIEMQVQSFIERKKIMYGYQLCIPIGLNVFAFIFIISITASLAPVESLLLPRYLRVATPMTS